MTIQIKAIEQYFPVVLFITLYKVVLTFESVDEIVKCDHSNESPRVTCDKKKKTPDRRLALEQYLKLGSV